MITGLKRYLQRLDDKDGVVEREGEGGKEAVGTCSITEEKEIEVDRETLSAMESLVDDYLVGMVGEERVRGWENWCGIRSG